MTSANNLRRRNNIDWKHLCFDEPLPRSAKKEVVNRQILDGSFQIERLIAKKQNSRKKTNRYDCAMDALKVRKSDYWEDDIRVIRSRRKFTICAAIKDADVISASKPCLDDEDDVENLTMVEIKQKLQDHGVATKIRKHDKLVQLYKYTVLQNHS
ncbi:unnamed protein product [Mytilus coruscus]|uniref:Uncharacterized protein n=1 Tax=Mytilus coruscus TaxID=42192 RepID=A0A6J8CN18_MYTCO|nr:unnamed protein product [Mytilus coruscus]